MSIKWFFYNYSNNVDGFFTPINEEKNTVLDEANTIIKTIDSLIPTQFDPDKLIFYQWTPIIGGNVYDGLKIILEQKIEEKWIPCTNIIVDINKASTGLTTINYFGSASGLKEKLFALQEWDYLGPVQYRPKLYIPNGKLATNFFFGLSKL